MLSHSRELYTVKEVATLFKRSVRMFVKLYVDTNDLEVKLPVIREPDGRITFRKRDIENLLHKLQKYRRGKQ